MTHITQSLPKSSLFQQGSLHQLESTVIDSSDEDVALHRARILRKLDIRIVPLMLITYGLQFLDKALLGYAAVYTFREDTHLHGQEYSWVGSIFYFGYLAFEYPLAAFLNTFPTPIYLGSFIFVWGICVVMTNFCVSFTGLMINRFILGALESVVAPCFVVITAHWYTPKEQPIRQVLWFLGTPIFGIFGGLLAYGLGNTHTDLTSWRLLYIVFGSVTAIWGLFFTWAFPVSPEKAKFLSQEERVIATLTTHSMGQSESFKWKWTQVREAFLDIKTYIFFIIGIFNTIPAGSLSNFSSLLIKGFGFTAVQTQLLGIPSHVIQIISILIAGFLSTKIPNARLFCMSLCVIPSIIGTALVYSLPSGDKWGRVVSVWIIYTNSASLAVSFAVIGGNVAGYTKKTTVTFLLFLGYCVGNIIAPQCFRDEEEKEGYPTAIIAMMLSFCVLFISPLALRYLYSKENKRRDAGSVQFEDSSGSGHMDYTDIENPDFRYSL